jgi:hypothetical protein
MFERTEQTDPLSLDPYSPTFPEWEDPEPLALDPYSPTPPARRSARHDRGHAASRAPTVHRQASAPQRATLGIAVTQARAATRPRT